jgi:hypothetical protein
VFKPHYGTLSVDVFHVRPSFDPLGEDWEAFYPATGRVSKNLQAEIANMVNLPWHTDESVGAPYHVEPYDMNLYYDEVHIFAKVPDVTTTKDPIANYAIQSHPISGQPGYYTPKVIPAHSQFANPLMSRKIMMIRLFLPLSGQLWRS